MIINKVYIALMWEDRKLWNNGTQGILGIVKEMAVEKKLFMGNKEKVRRTVETKGESVRVIRITVTLPP